MLKLNKSRTFPSPVTLHYINEEGRNTKGTFNAVFKVVGAEEIQDEVNENKRLLDLVLVSVSDIELADEDGKLLEGDELLNACKNDPAISNALIVIYGDLLTKKNPKRT